MVQWKDYRLKFVKNPAYSGKALGTLSVAEIEVLWEKRGKPFLKDNRIGLSIEAQMIQKAAEEVL